MSATDPKVLDEIVKAYDVRGTVPDQINPDVAHALGVGFAKFCGAGRLLVGRDMRGSGPELVEAFARGVMEQGATLWGESAGRGPYDQVVTAQRRNCGVAVCVLHCQQIGLSQLFD